MADGSAALTSPEHVRGRNKCVCTNADGRCHFGGHYRLPRSRAVAKAMLSGITSIAKADFREWKECVKSDHMEGMRISRYPFTREQAALLHCCRDPTTETRAQTVSAIEVLGRAWIQEAEDGLQKEKADHRVAPADVTSPKEASKRRRPSYIASDVERADDWFAHKETRKFPTHESCVFYRRVAQLFDARVVKELPSSGTTRPKTRQRDEDQEEDQTGEEKEGADGSGIVDGSETWLQVPSNLRLHKTFFATYKGHTMGKVLVLLGLDGKVWWISNVLPGKITDDDLVVQSGMLNIIPANTIVWADKGFSTLPSMRQRGIQVRTPTFKRRNTQFTMAEVKHSQFLSSYRIHVEHVIGAIKNTCRALHATVDLKEMKLTTSMWHAGALLVNLFHPPFAPQDPDIELSEPTEAEQTVL